jgi:hypothetical protein
MLRRSVAHLAAKCLRLENRVHTASARADGFADADAEARSPGPLFAHRTARASRPL